MRKCLNKLTDQDEQDSYAEARTGSIICGDLGHSCARLPPIPILLESVRPLTALLRRQAPIWSCDWIELALAYAIDNNWQLGNLIPKDSSEMLGAEVHILRSRNRVHNLAQPESDDDPCRVESNAAIIYLL